MTIEQKVALNSDSPCENPFNCQDDKDDNGCCSFLLLPSAIAAVIIASQYDDQSTPSCHNDNTNYLIDLPLFLYIGGYIQIGFCALRLLINCCSYGCDKKEKTECRKCIDCPGCLIGIFNLIWAGIGFYIYSTMNKQCQQTSIGIMILSWSIIQYAFVVLLILCAICFCCYHRSTIMALMKAECEKEKAKKNNKEQEGTATLV